MNLLAIATSGARGSLALGEFSSKKLQRPPFQVVWEKKAMHSELATVKLQELLSMAGKSLTELTHLAVVIGPGSFTGIRVGVNLARTLAYSLNLPVAPFTTLELIAANNLAEGQSGLIAMKALREFFYAAPFAREETGPRELSPIASLTRESLPKHLPTGGVVWAEGDTSGMKVEVEALDLLKGLDQSPGAKAFLSWREIHPLYIRGSEAEEKMKLGVLKPL